MKAVIVEISGRYAVALAKNGEFIKIRNNGRYKVGYEADIINSTNAGINTFARIASIAAMFVLVLGVGIGAYSYNMPYSYVDIDINPSIEITTNIFDRIIKVEALNDDGKELLGTTSYQNKELGDGIADVLQSAVQMGYLKEEFSAVIFTVTGKSDKKAAQIEKEVQAVASSELKEDGIEAEVIVEKTALDKHSEAKELGLTYGKLSLINKLIEARPELKVEELKDEPVKDIMKSIIESKKDNKDGEKDSKRQDKDKGQENKPDSKDADGKDKGGGSNPDNRKVDKKPEDLGKIPGEDKETNKGNNTPEDRNLQKDNKDQSTGNKAEQDGNKGKDKEDKQVDKKSEKGADKQEDNSHKESDGPDDKERDDENQEIKAPDNNNSKAATPDRPEKSSGSKGSSKSSKGK